MCEFTKKVYNDGHNDGVDAMRVLALGNAIEMGAYKIRPGKPTS